jgi:hypothetical protein
VYALRGETSFTLRIRSERDFWSGVVFVAIGLAIVVLAQEYRFGTSGRMGPGYFPTVLGALLSLLGLTLALPALVIEGERLPAMRVRPLLFVLGGIAAFSGTLEHLGFIAATVALVVVSGLADPELRSVEIAGLAVFLVLFSLTIFVLLLGLPLPVWPAL